MDVCFLITTHNRQESCQRLVDALQGQGDIYVLNDGCDYDISGVTEQIKRDYHFGKPGYWCTVNQLFNMRGNHKYYFMLPDDFLPTPDMVSRAIGLWENLRDGLCMCINLYPDRVGKRCWTNFYPIDVGDLWLTQWVDMCFICKDEFFLQVGSITPIKFDWKRHPKAGSGVGAYISRKLHNHGYHLYMVKESLVIPQKEHQISKMNVISTNSHITTASR